MNQTNQHTNMTRGFFLLLMMTGLLTGCSHAPNMPKSYTTTGQSRVQEMAPSVSTNQPVPSEIAALETASRDLFEDAKAQNWSQVSAKQIVIDASRPMLKENRNIAMSTVSRIDQLTADLNQKILSKDKLSVMKDANELNQAANQLSQSYKQVAPKEVAWLDYYGRALQIGALSQDKGLLKNTTNNIKTTWEKLKSEIPNAADNQQAIQFDSLIQRLEKAQTFDDYNKEATQVVDQASNMKIAFANQSKTTGQSAVQGMPATSATHITIPHSVSSIDQVSEDIYDSAKAQDWSKVSEKLAVLDKARPMLKEESKMSQPQLDKIDHLASDLSKKIASKDKLGVMKDANELNRSLISVSHTYMKNMPKEVPLLDYYGRELEIGALSKDKSKLTVTTHDIQTTWNTLKPEVNNRGAKDEALKFDSLVKRIEKAQTYPEFSKEAAQVLEHVDKLETVFKTS